MCAKKSAGEKRKRTKRVKDPNAPKRPLSSYMLFCQEERENVKTEHPEMKAKEILSELGKRWKQLDEDEKKKYTESYEEDKERYKKEMAEYEAKKEEEGSEESEEEEPRPKRGKRKAKKQESDDEEDDE